MPSTESFSPAEIATGACDRKSPIAGHKYVNNVGVNCKSPSMPSPPTATNSGVAVHRPTAGHLYAKDTTATSTKDSTSVLIVSPGQASVSVTPVRPRQNPPNRRRWTALERYLTVVGAVLFVACVGLVLLVAFTRTASTGRSRDRCDERKNILI